MKAYEYRHQVSFEETNLVGNVYYTHYLRWQGICRERFIRDHAPEVAEQLNDGLALVTTRVSCQFFREVRAFDEVVVQMLLRGLFQNRVTMGFDYWVQRDTGAELVAQGEQQIASLRRVGTEAEAVPLPEGLRAAVQAYA